MRHLLILSLALALSLSAYAGNDVTTLQELEQDVKNNLATEADPFHPDSVLDDFINMACRELAGYGAIEKLDSVILSSGQPLYALDSVCLEIVSVFPCTVNASQGLDRIDTRDWGKIAASSQLTTSRYYAFQPAYYAEKKAWAVPRIRLYPAHSGLADTLLIVYYAQANELTADTDTTNVPYEYRYLVVIHATAQSFARAQEYNKASWWFSLYDQERQRKGLIKPIRLQVRDYIVKSKEIDR